MVSGRGSYEPVTAEDEQLISYRYVKVRVACRKCHKLRSYSLAFLAERFGSRITMTALLDHLTIYCSWRIDDRVSPARRSRRPPMTQCEAYFPDLSADPPSPDLPEDLQPPPKGPKL